MLSGQSIYWVTPCTNQTFCLNQGSCTAGYVYLVEKAVTTCGSQFVNFSYKIDLGNNGSIDIQSSEDTVHQDFPLGTHQITWRASDNCSNINTSCSYLFTVKDCNPPNLLCRNGLTQNLESPECAASFDAVDFIINVNDNCTPLNQIDIGIREAGSGTGFPADSSLSFGICDKGLHIVEIWVRDENNLINQCNSYVLVQDNNGDCTCNEFADIGLQGCVTAPDSTRLENYTVRAELTGTPPQGAPIATALQTNFTDSCYSLTFKDLPYNGSYSGLLRAQRYGDQLNGVSTFDLVLINKHILGQQALANFYQVFAADVNQSKTITTFDIIEIRKLILGIYDTLPNTPPWRFIRPVPDPAVLTAFDAVRDTYAFTLPNLLQDTVFKGLNFFGIKMGDVNTNAFLIGPAEDRAAAPPLLVGTENFSLQAGEERWIDLYPSETTRLEGWQLALQTDLNELEIKDVRGIPAQFVHLLPSGELRLSCINETPAVYGPGRPLVSLWVAARRPGQLSKGLWTNSGALYPEVYPADGVAARTLAFQIGRATAPKVVISAPAPNPFAGETAFNLALPQDMPVRLDVFDGAGRPVFQTAVRYPAGQHSLVVPGDALPASGVWMYRVQAGPAIRTGRLIRL